MNRLLVCFASMAFFLAAAGEAALAAKKMPRLKTPLKLSSQLDVCAGFVGKLPSEIEAKKLLAEIPVPKPLRGKRVKPARIPAAAVALRELLAGNASVASTQMTRDSNTKETPPALDEKAVLMPVVAASMGELPVARARMGELPVSVAATVPVPEKPDLSQAIAGFAKLCLAERAEAAKRVTTTGYGLAPPSPAEVRRVFQMRATWYQVGNASPLGSQTADGIPLLDPNGRELGPRLSPKDWCNTALNGSVNLRISKKERRIYGFASSSGPRQVDCRAALPELDLKPELIDAMERSRFRQVRGARFSRGASGKKLQPLRSIAVDPRFIPYGSVVFVPAARGRLVTLPNRRKVVHDGYFLAVDTGGAIRKNRVDVFLDPSIPNPFTDLIRGPRIASFEAYLVENEAARKWLLRVHG